MKIGTRLYSAVALMAFVAIAIGVIGLYTASQSNQSLDTVFQDRVVPLEQIKTISDVYAVNIVDTTHKAMGGAVNWADAGKSVADAQEKIIGKWRAYLGTYLVPEEQKLIDEITPLMKRGDDAVARLKKIIANEDQAELARFAGTQLYPAIDPLTAKLSELVTVQLAVARQEYLKSDADYHKGVLYASILFIGGLILSTMLAFFVVRRLLRDLGGEPAYLREIARSVADGDLSVAVSVADDKQGSVLSGMKIMVVNLNKLQNELVEHITELEATLARVNQLEGIIPICASCKKIRDEENSWHTLERFISDRSDAEFSHALCPHCADKQKKIYDNYFLEQKQVSASK